MVVDINEFPKVPIISNATINILSQGLIMRDESTNELDQVYGLNRFRKLHKLFIRDCGEAHGA